VFSLPFFIINCLKLRRRQKIGLVGIFSLGAITIIISLSRFIVYAATEYSVDDADGSKHPISLFNASLHLQIAANQFLLVRADHIADAWCTAEMSTAVIVVSLPSLKALIVRATPNNTSNRSTNGYMRGSIKHISHGGHGGGTFRSHIEGGRMDDEVELVSLDRKPSSSPIGTTREKEMVDGKEKAVTVTTNVTVMRDVL
jgi:hypothetical protein